MLLCCVAVDCTAVGVQRQHARANDFEIGDFGSSSTHNDKQVRLSVKSSRSNELLHLRFGGCFDGIECQLTIRGAVRSVAQIVVSAATGRGTLETNQVSFFYRALERKNQDTSIIVLVTDTSTGEDQVVPRRVVGDVTIQRTTNQRTQLSRGGDALRIMSGRTDVAICHTAVHNKLI